MRLKKRWLAGLMLACGLVQADEALLRQPSVRAFVHEMVVKEHFNERELVSVLRQAQFQPQIIASMERPYEKKTWDVYQALFLTSQRVDAGVAYWRAHQAALQKASQRFGVPESMIVAILGIETLYGQHQGTYRVLDALTTLAFYYPKRAPFFTKELKEYLLLCRDHHVVPTRYLGSYAGAMGKPQFMPSSYRFYAVDMQGGGRPDLMTNDADVIGSVANYFHKHGWAMHQPVAQPARVRGWGYHKIPVNTRAPSTTMTKLRQAGVHPVGWLMHTPEQAGLVELMMPKGTEYWIAYPNFYVITRYNTSPQYALVAYLFAQRLQQKWAMLPQNRGTHARLSICKEALC